MNTLKTLQHAEEDNKLRNQIPKTPKTLMIGADEEEVNCRRKFMNTLRQICC